MKKPLTDVWDDQQQKTIPMHPGVALSLTTKYPSRFKIVASQTNIKTGENKMPQLPQSTKALENGLHILNAIEVRTTNGQYGQQEEVTCLKEGTNDVLTRVWVPHNNLKRITEASGAGLVRIDQETNSWEVLIGARFQVFVSGGKILQVMPAPPIVIQTGNQA